MGSECYDVLMQALDHEITRRAEPLEGISALLVFGSRGGARPDPSVAEALSG